MIAETKGNTMALNQQPFSAEAKTAETDGKADIVIYHNPACGTRGLA